MTKSEATEKWLELIRPYYAIEYALVLGGIPFKRARLTIAFLVEGDRCTLVRGLMLKRYIDSLNKKSQSN